MPFHRPSGPSRCLVSLTFLTVLLVASAPGAKVWTGANGTSWADGGNWSPSGVPGNGEDVTITNAANEVVLSSDSANLHSLIISNNTLTFENWDTELHCTNVTIRADGKFALPGEFTDSEVSNRVYVVCQNLTIEAGGMIDADGGGFGGWYGPGAGSHSSALYQSGGSYGGKGGAGARIGSTAYSVPANPYGNPAMPIHPGSGGGSHSSHQDKAGAGGGAVYIDASDTVTIHGTISADGNPAKNVTSGQYGTGGSGGGIYISCGTFGGSTNGLIRARGGDAYNVTASGGAGGGGRIAVDYGAPAAQDFVRFSASAGEDWATQDLDNRWSQRPHAGTLWLPDTGLLDDTLSENQFQDIRIMGIESWSIAGSLNISNCVVDFAEDGFVLSVDGNLRIGSGGGLGIGADTEGTNYTLLCSGSVLVTNGGSLTVYAGSTNDAGPAYGARVKVTNFIRVGSASWIYPVCHSEDGGAVKIEADDLVVAAGGGIKSDARGFGYGLGYGVSVGAFSGGTHMGGSGHGGFGGANGAGGTDSEAGGEPYGSVSVPLAAGSGGGAHSGHTNNAGFGGGVVWLDIGNSATINGTLSAGGADTEGYFGAPGSGGSVYLKCNTFGGTTNGLLSVKGGTKLAYLNYACGSGGGRMAVDYQSVDATHDVRFCASPAENEWAVDQGEVTYIAFRSQMGTLYLPDTALLDTVLSQNQFEDVRLFGPASWSPASLTVSNCSVTFAEPEFALDVTGDIRVDTDGQLGIGDRWAGSNSVLRCQGDLILTNGGDLYVYAGQTNGTGKSYGTLVRVTNDIVVGPSSWIFPYAHGYDGGSPYFSASNLLIAAGGGIRADSAGYASINGPGVGIVISQRVGGSGYGGRGGASKEIVEGGHPYGSVHMPREPGSGGSGYSPNRSKWGGVGGGLVWVNADDTITVNGTVTANGCPGREQYAGGGSGGGIYLKCDTFGGASSGLLRADGGDGPVATTPSGGGGGGRIAIDYDNLAATHEPAFSVAPAVISPAFADLTNQWQLIPRVGTVSFSDAGMLSTTLTDAQFPGDVSLFFQDISSWNPASLTVSNCWVAFGQDNFNVIVDGDVVVDTGGALGLGHYHDGSNYTLSVGGSLILTNGGELYVYGGLTNAMGEGDVSAVVAVTNDVIVRSGSRIFPAAHDTDGGSPVFRMRDMLIEEGAWIEANGKGYRSKTGPGAGESVANTKNGGGGYGGKGGDGDGGFREGGQPYGLTNGPALPGSAGGTYGAAGVWEPRGGAGGGPVRIEARRNVTVDGTITADGGDGLYHKNYSAGGAGGGIYILCSNFLGGAQAVMRAEGGDEFLIGQNYNGGGGGGRVTVWQNVPYENRTNYLAGGSEPDLLISTNFPNYDGVISVTNGIGATFDPAEPGTMYFLRIKPPNTYELAINSTPADYGGPQELDYGTHLDIPVDTWITNSVTSPTNETIDKRWVCLGFDLKDYDNNAISNYAGTQAEFKLTTNLVLTWHWTNQWLLTVGHGPNGVVNSNAVNGWYTNLVTTPYVWATSDVGYLFNEWTGDFPPGYGTANPLTNVVMDQARWVTGTFALAVRETNVWSGTGTWDTVGNWSLTKLPKTIDDAVVKSGLLIMDSPRYVASLTVSNGATLLFTNWSTKAYVTENMWVLSNATVTCAGPFPTFNMSNRVDISCSNLVVEAGGAIDVDAKGFSATNGPGVGGVSTATSHSGGAYGGRGGRGQRSSSDTQHSMTYGSASQPLDPGSGGGAHVNHGDAAGAGGGAVHIVASAAVTVDGTITAAGEKSPGEHGAGGSGGGILIVCDTFGGNDGTIQAQGGDDDRVTGSAYGGGGGGRIAVHYNSLAAQRNLHFSTAPAWYEWGWQDPDNRWPHTSRQGTLWLPDTNLLASPITDNLFSNCSVYVDGVASMEVDSLTISNASFTFPTNGFELRIVGDLLLGKGGSLGIGNYYEDGGSNFLLSVGGGITLTNGGQLHAYAGETNGVSGDEGILVTVTNDIAVGPSSWVIPYCQETNGGTPRFVIENLIVASGGGINASGRGYLPDHGPGVGYFISNESGGGGYGGHGGSSQEESYGGDAYGSVYAPVEPGSGGGSHYDHTEGAGAGGGVIRVAARDTVTVDGTIRADGAYAVNQFGGGGSGGSVYLQCDTFGGSGGLITATGGEPLSTNNAGAGAGGRIAVDYNTLDGSPTVAFSAQWGSNGWPRAEHVLEHRWHHRAQAGTLSLPDLGLLSDTLTTSLFAGDVNLYFPSITSWNLGNLTVDGCAVTFAQNEFALTVTNTLRVDGGSFGLGAESGSNWVLTCGDVVVTNGGNLYVYAGVTNNGAQTYGSLVDVDGDITIGPSSWIHPIAQRTNGSTVFFDAQNVFIAAAGGFNANAKGYQSLVGPGHATINASYAGGSGFGGKGGDSSTGTAGGPTYGSTNAPVQPGSGGGSHNSSGYILRGGAGGGSVRVDASGRLTLRGTVTANGAKGFFNHYGGGGSGGGVYLFCGKFVSGPNALLSAEGGAGAPYQDHAGGGGGGRIAVWEGLSGAQRATVLAGGGVPRLVITNDMPATYHGTASVTNGTGATTDPAEVGTVRYLYVPPPAGSMIILR